ncbi:MAG: ribonuclease P protein component [Ginsengibacter sp.]
MIQQRFTFTKVERLKSLKLIGQIFKEGKSFAYFPFRGIYIYPKENSSYLQATFSVSSKNFKKAVDRNRIKRLMREAYRLQKNALKTKLERSQIYLAVFIIYTGNELPVFEKILEKMEHLLERLEKAVPGNQEN